MTPPPTPPLTPPALPRRRCLQWASGLLLAPLWPGLAAQPAAAPAARLRFSLERDARRLEVGQALIVRLEVWVSTWFQAPVEFPATLTAEGALVEVVGGSPDSRFEDFGGRRWTGLIRRYRLLPVQPGELSVNLAAPLLVQPGGGNGRPQPLGPPAPLRLSVRLPAGAEDIQPFVAAHRLELRQRWWPEATAANTPLQVGDLVRREIVLVTDSTSPLLPATDFGAPPGVAVRVQAAEVQEQRTNAAATPTLTRRHESVYTLHQAGAAELPAVEIVWWDLQQRRRRVTRLEGRDVVVAPAAQRSDPFAVAVTPAAADAGAARGTAGGGTGRVAIAALLATGALGLAALLARRRAGRGAGAAPDAPSPRTAWSQLRHACQRSDARAATVALQALWSTLTPGEQSLWLRDAAFVQARDALARHRFGPGGADAWQGEALWNAARGLRRKFNPAARPVALPTLHP
jgi:hypothetical protein